TGGRKPRKRSSACGRRSARSGVPTGVPTVSWPCKAARIMARTHGSTSGSGQWGFCDGLVRTGCDGPVRVAPYNRRTKPAAELANATEPRGRTSGAHDRVLWEHGEPEEERAGQAVALGQRLTLE